MTDKNQKKVAKQKLAKGLRLLSNPDGTYTDQYGRVLQPYTNDKGEPDLRPIGLDPKGARH